MIADLIRKLKILNVEYEPVLSNSIAKIPLRGRFLSSERMDLVIFAKSTTNAGDVCIAGSMMDE